MTHFALLEKSAKPRWLKELGKLQEAMRFDESAAPNAATLARLEGAADKSRMFIRQLLSGQAIDKLPYGALSPLSGRTTHPVWKTHTPVALGRLHNLLNYDAATSFTGSKLWAGKLGQPMVDTVRDAHRALSSMKNVTHHQVPQPPGPVWPHSTSEMVRIEHGGTMEFLKKFMSGKTKGYAGDGGGAGIMVHPGDAAESMAYRTPWYAGRASASNLEQPARLSAMVPSKFLAGAPNGYEATLLHDGVQHLRDVRLTTIKADPAWRADISEKAVAALEAAQRARRSNNPR